MLTSYQVEAVAYSDEYGTLLCPRCFEDGDVFAKPVIRYLLDEWDQAVSEYGFDDERHAFDCECTVGVYCESCGATLSEPYEDDRCKEV